MTARTRKGFTLVELLVVIGIIAVLISILLPSLAKARETALTIQCSANLRSIGQALAMYSDDNKGYYPHGWVNADTNQDGTAESQVYWPATLAYYMQGKQAGNPWSDTINASMSYFKCPSVPYVPLANWVPVGNYGGHPIVFMTEFWTSAANGNKIEAYKAVWLQRNATEKAIVWDATVETAGGNIGWTFPGSGNVNGDQLWWGDFDIDAPQAWQSWMDQNTRNTWGNGTISLNGVFRDKPDNCWDNNNSRIASSDTMRFRHNGNTGCNILFGDGHVETRRATQTRDSMTFAGEDQGRTDLLRRNFEVPWQVNGIRMPF